MTHLGKLALTCAIASAIGACSLLGSGDPTAGAASSVISDTFKAGCGAISIADGFFQAGAPALVEAGKLTPADLAKEQAIFKTAQATCANPPADPVTAGTILVADAASIYLMLSVKP